MTVKKLKELNAASANLHRETSTYEEELSSDQLTLIVKNKTGNIIKTVSYLVKTDEPEDMIFGRSLEETDSISSMVRLAYSLGELGIPLTETESEE